MSKKTIPTGFMIFGKDDSFNDAIAPVYINTEQISSGASKLKLGLLIDKHHCNYVGFCHGGAIMSLMDLALSTAVCIALDKITSTPTVSTNFNFIASAKQGDWIECQIESVNLSRTMGFASALITGPKGDIARASGCFKLPANLETADGMPVQDYLNWRTTPQS